MSDETDKPQTAEVTPFLPRLVTEDEQYFKHCERTLQFALDELRLRKGTMVVVVLVADNEVGWWAGGNQSRLLQAGALALAQQRLLAR